MTTTELANSVFPLSSKNNDKTARNKQKHKYTTKDDDDDDNNNDDDEDNNTNCQRVIERFHSIFASGELYGLDEEGFHTFLHPNFTFISPQGRILSRSKFIQQLQQQQPSEEAVEIYIHDFQILNQHKEQNQQEQDITTTTTSNNDSSSNNKSKTILQELILCSYQEWQRNKKNKNKKDKKEEDIRLLVPDDDDDVAVTARQCTTLLRKIKQQSSSQQQQQSSSSSSSITTTTTWEWVYMHQTWLEGMGGSVQDEKQQQESANTKVNNNDKVLATSKKNNKIMVVPSTTRTVATIATERPEMMISQLDLVSPRRYIAHESLWPDGIKPITTTTPTMETTKTTVIGMEVCGVLRVLTTQGPMANKAWYDQTIHRLKQQQLVSSSYGLQPARTTRRLLDSTILDDDRYRRRSSAVLSSLPEVCFDQAAITIQLLGRYHGTILSWTAWYALMEWSRYYNYCCDDDNQSNMNDDDEYYDWTFFSTPFTCHVSSPSSFFYWKPLQQNGIDMMQLKKEEEEVLLYYDEIDLYKDELRRQRRDTNTNNFCGGGSISSSSGSSGMVTCRVKIRLMSTYLFLLFRVMIRVNHVMILVRDTRILIQMEKKSTNTNADDEVFRTVTWRRCDWKDLSKSWRDILLVSDNNSRGDRTDDEIVDYNEEDLVSTLPVIQLPKHIPMYSKLVSRAHNK